MNELSERLAFTRTLLKNPYDEATHRVFADWLDEHGYHEEAEVQRKWTKEKQQIMDSVDWMMELATKAGRTYGELMALADQNQVRRLLKDWKAEEFWRHYETINSRSEEDVGEVNDLRDQLGQERCGC